MIEGRDQAGFVLELAENRRRVVGRIQDLGPVFSGSGTDQVKTRGFYGVGPRRLDQFQRPDDGVRPLDGRPGDRVRHVHDLPDQVEGGGRQALLQFQGMGVLQQLPRQLPDKTQLSAVCIGTGQRVVHQGGVVALDLQRLEQLLDGCPVETVWQGLAGRRSDLESGPLSDVDVVQGKLGQGSRRSGQGQVGGDFDLVRV